MNGSVKVKQVDEYRTQIEGYAQSLALGKHEAVQGLYRTGPAGLQVEMFVEDNLEKRARKLQDQLEFVAPGFDEFEKFIGQYILQVPLAAYDSGCSDGERFLQWLAETQPLTREQQDLVTCQRSRHAVEFTAQKNRFKHVRFQGLRTVTQQMTANLDNTPELWIYLNPIRVWATFQTKSLLDEDADVPATVLFYPLGSDIRTAVVEPTGQAVIKMLEELSPCQLDDLVFNLAELERSDIIECCHDLTDMGLAALG